MRITELYKPTLLVLGLASLGLFLLGSKPALASNPATINFQGKVVNADGTNVTNGTYSFVFRIYDSANPSIGSSCSTDSHCKWEETQSSVTVTNGVFQVELGSACALTSGSCNNSSGGPINWSTTTSLYLTLKFGSDTSGTCNSVSSNGFMCPAMHITSVPFALQADNSSTLGGIAASGFIQNNSGSAQASSSFHIDGTGIADTQLQAPLFDTATSAGSLGIGTSNAGVITQGNVTNSTFIFQTKSSATAFQVQNNNSRDLLTIDTQNNIVQIGNSTDGSAITLAATGNVNATIRKSTTVTNAINAHDIVMLDTSNAGQVTQDNSFSGIVFGIATTTNASTAAQDIVTGGIYQVNLSTTSVAVAIGDDLIAAGSNDNGKAIDGGPCDSTKRMVGRALESKSAGVGGTIWTLISPGSGNTSQGSQGACPANNTTLQTAYNASSGSTTPEILLQGGDNTGVDIQNSNGSPVTGSLFAVRNGTASGLGTAMFSIDNNGLISLQPAANLTSGQTEVSQTFTNGSSTGGTVNSYSQTISVSNTSSASTTNGINISLTDSTTGSLANVNQGVTISLGGTNSSQEQTGANVSVNHGIALVASSSGTSGGSITCGSTTFTSLAICAAQSGTATTGTGLYAETQSGGSSLGAGAGTAIYGINTTSSLSASTFYTGVTGVAGKNVGSTSATTIGIYGATTGTNIGIGYGGYFVYGGGSGSGAALYASNSTAAANILDVQDNTTDVLRVANDGATTISSINATSGNAVNALTVTGGTGAGTATAGNGSNITLTAGNGGNGSTANGNGGNLTLSAGAAGTGAGSAGSAGSVIVKNQSNSASAFQVQNASSGNLLNVDSLLSNITLLGNNDGQTGAWTNQASNLLPGNRAYSTSIVANGYAYVIGGGPSNSIYYAKLNADGSTGAWTNQASNLLPSAREGATSVYANGFIYALGGSSGSGATNTVYYAKLNADGSTGAWTNQASNLLPGNVEYGTSVVSNGYAYVFGGTATGANSTNIVYYAKLNADGSTGAWTNQASNLLPGNRDYATTILANGYVYVIGGCSASPCTTNVTNTVFYTKFNSDGSTGAWTNQVSNLLPGNRESATSVASNGYIYVLGGTVDGSTVENTVYYAKLNADGSTGAWTNQASNLLPSAREGATSVTANGYAYVFGGTNDGGTTQFNNVYYASFSRVKVGGNLDLLGIQGQTLADSGNLSLGSTGGAITAGDITGVGNLQIQGQGNFAQSVGIIGNITVSGGAFFEDSANSTAAFQVQNTSGSSLITADTLNGQVLLGTNSTLAGKLVFNSSSTGSVSIVAGSTSATLVLTLPTAAAGSNNQCIVSSTGGALSFLPCGAGSTAVAVLAPEFVGAVMTPTQSGTHTGTMTSDYCSGTSRLSINTSICTVSTDEHNYYSWTANATNNYDIVVRWQVPNDFASFSSSGNSFYNWNSSSSDTVTMRVYNSSSSTCASQAGGSTNGTWNSQSITMTSCTPSAGSMITIDIELSVGVNGEFARVGEITLNYNRN